MTELFKCPNCNSQYKLVRVEADPAVSFFWILVPVSCLLVMPLAAVIGETALWAWLCYMGVALAVLFWGLCRLIAEQVKNDRIRKQATRFYESDEGKRFLERQTEQAEKQRQLDNELQKKQEREAMELWHDLMGHELKGGTGGPAKTIHESLAEARRGPGGSATHNGSAR